MFDDPPSHARDGDTLSSSPTSSALHDEEGPGTGSGKHYVVTETVAQGGMGRILRARDRRLGRDVAIKQLIRPSTELAARFEREVRITAALQHPSIVTVHEAGIWHDGEPFYAMELVAGRALDAVARDAVTVAERLALVPHVIAVADALAYAHSRGVIHRDLKPSNVIVGEFGETVVIDWGVAKDLRAHAESETPLPYLRGNRNETAFGAVVGTPAFMPPEQARGDQVDERADVYAIGAMLYAVLAGRPPFEGGTTDAILDRVIDERPPALTVLEPGAPLDLVAIVSKAMSRVPENRYADARELARDLRRFQTGQLVEARRYTAPQRIRRFIARHRTIVAVTAGAAALLAAISSISIARIIDERDRAEVARGQADAERGHAETERSRADTERTGAEGLVSFMLTELKPKLERVGRLDVMQDVAKHVDTYYNALPSADHQLDPAATLRRVAALQVLGDVLYLAGDSAASNRSYNAAITLAAPLASQRGDAAIALARAQTELAAAQVEDGKLDDAQALLEHAGPELEAVHDHASVAVALAMVHRRLGTVAFQRGKLDESLAHLARCVDAVHPVLDDPVRGHDARTELAKCYDRRSDAESGRGRWRDAEQAVRAALQLRQDIVRNDPGDLTVQHGIAISWDKLFMLAMESGKPAEARADAVASIAAIEPLASRDPDNADWARALATDYERLAWLASASHRPVDAAIVMNKAVAVLEPIVARDATNNERAIDLADALGHQAEYMTAAHDPEHALAVLHRAAALAHRASAAEPANLQYAWSVASVDQLVGEAYARQGKLVDAISSYRTSLQLYERLVRDEPHNSDLNDNAARTRFKLGEILAGQPAQRAEGFAMMRAALAALRQLHDRGLLSRSSEQDLNGLEARLLQMQGSSRE